MMPSFSEAVKVWLRIGVFSFGGPAGQIALIHREVLDERKWIEEREFLSALNFCMLLPGPEAMQLATYIGWKLHGVKGGLAAGLLFVLPGALVILALSVLYAVLGKLSVVEGLFWGIKAAVLVIVLEAEGKSGLGHCGVFVFGLVLFWVAVSVGHRSGRDHWHCISKH
jgi:chromate transporter